MTKKKKVDSIQLIPSSKSGESGKYKCRILMEINLVTNRADAVQKAGFIISEKTEKISVIVF